MSAKVNNKNLIQRPGSSVWYLRHMRDGKLIMISTKETDIGKARDYRDKKLVPLKLEDDKDALDVMAVKISNVETLIQRHKDELPATTIQDGWQAYLEQTSRPDSGPVTLGQYEGWFEAFAKWITPLHPDVLELRHVSQDIADKYASHLQTKVSATTFNRHINTLALIWRVLEKIARLTQNPWKQITRKKFVAHSRRELTVEELGRIIKAAKGEMKMLIAFGIYTGLRLGDCACMRWDNIDMVKRIISVIPSKTARRTKKRVTVPIHPTLFQLLHNTPSGKRRGFVMANCEARYHQFNAALAKDVATLFRSVGIQTQTEATETVRGRPDAGFHSLRHTFVSLCAAGGVPQSVVQSLVGHGSPAMTAHYTHIGTETARAAIGSLPNVGGLKGEAESADAAERELNAVLAKLKTLKKDQLRKIVDKCKALMK
jgi:integrase